MLPQGSPEVPESTENLWKTMIFEGSRVSSLGRLIFGSKMEWKIDSRMVAKMHQKCIQKSIEILIDFWMESK